jgi:hypothetical protein
MTAHAIPISLVRICKSCVAQHPEKDALTLVSKSKAKEVSRVFVHHDVDSFSKHEEG